MTEFSCHTWAFNDLTLVEALGTIARLGFRYVDMGTGPHLNITRATQSSTRQSLVREIRDDLELFNLQLADLYLMLPRISVDDEKKRQADITLFKALLPFARSVGAPGVTISAGLIHPEEDDSAYQRTVISLKEMVEAADAQEMPISIEPHLDSMAQTPQQALRLLDEIQGLDITLDWAQMVCQNVKDKDIALLLPRTRHIQIRQAARSQLQVPYKRGRIKPEDVIRMVQQADYRGKICIEYMQTVGWHGMVEVNSIIEVTAMRDALRTARDAVST